MKFIIINTIYLIFVTYILKFFKINLIFKTYLNNLKNIINIFKLNDEDKKINLLLSSSIILFKNIFKIVGILILIVLLTFLFNLLISEFYENLFTINFIILTFVYIIFLYILKKNE